MSLKCAYEVDHLQHLREKMRELREDAEQCRRKIIDAGGGESRIFKALVVHVRAHIAKYNGHYRVDIKPKEGP